MTPRPFARDLGHGFVDQSPTRALAAADAQQIGQHIHCMHAHQHGTRGAKIAFDEGQMLDGLDGRFVDAEIEGAADTGYRRAVLATWRTMRSWRNR